MRRIVMILGSVLTDGLTIRGVGLWVAATVLVSLFTALATLLLPVFVGAQKVDSKS